MRVEKAEDNDAAMLNGNLKYRKSENSPFGGHICSSEKSFFSSFLFFITYFILHIFFLFFHCDGLTAHSGKSC